MKAWKENKNEIYKWNQRGEYIDEKHKNFVPERNEIDKKIRKGK